MKRILWIVAVVFSLQAQSQVFNYEELNDGRPKPESTEWKKVVAGTRLEWGNTDMRYDKYALPSPNKKNGKTLRLHAWRGESVNAQAVIYTGKALTNTTVSTSPLKAGKNEISTESLHTAFVRYVLTDEFGYGCGARPDATKYDSSLVAEVFSPNPTLDIEACTTRPIWLRIQVPQDAAPGTYKGSITVQADGLKPQRLNYELEVANRTLPDPSEWKFHLDLWQNPYSVAHTFGVPLWSEEHFNCMRPIMQRLAAAGQKVITTTLMTHPWNGQTEIPFKSMIAHIRNIDGSWMFDYSVFDRWVEFMMSLGIDQQINCYTVVPWALTFDYFDRATNSVKHVHAKPGDAEYEAYWLPFLKDFARHLKDKGWFERTAIALDERALPQMREAFRVVFKADPDFKISGAAHYYAEIEPMMYDLCLAYGEKLPDDVLKRRQQEGKITTTYTCCTEPFPNMFTFSPPAEASWLPWHTAAEGFNGYLRWAYNSWSHKVLQDTRFRAFPAGDCYMVYPSGSGIRMERLIEGIQDVEKVRILREEFAREGETEKLQKLNSIVARFVPTNMNGTNAADMVNLARKELRALQ